MKTKNKEITLLWINTVTTILVCLNLIIQVINYRDRHAKNNSQYHIKLIPEVQDSCTVLELEDNFKSEFTFKKIF